MPRGAAQAACLEQEGGDHLRNMRWRGPTRAKRSRAIRAVRPGVSQPRAPQERPERNGASTRRPNPVIPSQSDYLRPIVNVQSPPGEKRRTVERCSVGELQATCAMTTVHKFDAPTYMRCIGRPQDDAGGLMRTHRAGGSAHAPKRSMGGRRSHTESQDHCANDQTRKVPR